MAVLFDRREQAGCRYHTGEIRKPWTVRYADAQGKQRERSFRFREDAELFLREIDPEPPRRTGTVIYRDVGFIVYRLFDSTGNLLYVGQSSAGPSRIFDHHRIPWTHAEYEGVSSQLIMNEVEDQLIHASHPPHNKLCRTCRRIEKLEKELRVLRAS